MKTSASPLCKNNCNAKAFALAVAIYACLIASVSCAFLFKADAQEVNAGSGVYSFELQQVSLGKGPASAEPSPAPKQLEAEKSAPQQEDKAKHEVKEQPKEEPVIEALKPDPAIVKPIAPKKKPKPVVKHRHKKHAPKASKARVAAKQSHSDNRNVKATSRPLGADGVGRGSGKAAGGAKGQVLVYGKDNHPLLSGIKNAIDRNLIYPHKARAMRYQGVAVIKFKVAPPNKVTSAAVIKSSGKDILDQGAVQTIYRASSYFPKVNEPMIIIIPIKYQLR